MEAKRGHSPGGTHGSPDQRRGAAGRPLNRRRTLPEPLGAVQTETAEIGSDVHETPVIPDAPVSVPGVSETEVSLNDTEGNGTWKFLYEIPDYTAEDGVPYPTEENQDFDFAAWEDKNWQDILVPGEPLMQGFDVLTQQRILLSEADHGAGRFRGKPGAGPL